ncbi:helix-turn-helix domain-containing protein [Streptomyces odontomachi]|uniref:helix-turn-helix domain-containing protein n=1 Tax=Streptomyces odontomachi TaxID=2944940 RepID=UPI00210C8638|nr:helix-turn-helix transcriptional regulator [Streptomyces sp. ODS25]
MPDSKSARIGLHVRELRKRRGLTQRELASASAVSLATIRKLEQGTGGEPRLETLRALAIALQVSTSTLLRRDAPADEPAGDEWAEVRAALMTSPTPTYAGEGAPTARGLHAALQAAGPLFSSDRFAELATVLPSLLRDAGVLDTVDPLARACRGRLLQLTGWLLTQMRQFDAAEHALTRALAVAVDEQDGAATITTQCWLMLRTGRLAEARQLAERWADDVEPRLSRATADELSSWGWLTLRLSAAAVRDARPEEAADALRMAKAAAAALGREHTPGGDFLRTFGPTTVTLKRTENAAVSGRPDVVLQLAEQIRSAEMPPTSNNWNRHLLDVADAHARLRHYAEAVDVLDGINVASPQWLPQQRYARDIMSRVIKRRRTLTPQMRTLADVTGVPV